jgi:hypothetical protein
MSPSGRLRCVDLALTDVSVEIIASVFFYGSFNDSFSIETNRHYIALDVKMNWKGF